MIAAVLVTLAGIDAGVAQPRDAPVEQTFEDLVQVLDSWLDAEFVFNRVPAMSVGLTIGDRMWTRGYGTIDEHRRVPADGATIYGICSISKLFTAVSVMQLWETGAISLDDDVRRTVPSLTIRGDEVYDGRISIHSLLTHSSGLPREADTSYWPGPEFSFPTREQLLQQLTQQSAFMAPQTRWEYSNVGMAILGELIRRKSGRDYSDYVTRQVLEPLGLSDTRPRLPRELYGTRLAPGFSALNRAGTRDRVHIYDAQGMTPAIGFSSTVHDLLVFAQWQFRVKRTQRREVLDPATLDAMHRVQWVDPDGKRRWGLGFDLTGSEAGYPVVGHEGACPGYETVLRMALDDESAVAMMSNATDMPGSSLAKVALGLVRKRQHLPADAASDIQTSDNREYVGHYPRQPWATDQVVARWGSGLAILDLPSEDPVRAITLLRYVRKDVFRALRDDDSPADEVRFVRDPSSGSVIGYLRWSQLRRKRMFE